MGNEGNDALFGGAGNDSFAGSAAVDTDSDVFGFLAGSGTDIVFAFDFGDDGDALDIRLTTWPANFQT